MNITDSVFTDNAAGYAGGALVLLEASVIIIRSTFSNNTASIRGGTVNMVISTLNFIQTAFSGNSALSGGIAYSEDSLVLMNNVTADLNVANSGFVVLIKSTAILSGIM